MSIDYQVCNCPCHNEGSNMLHIVACCRPCPACETPIKDNCYQDHIDRCEMYPLYKDYVAKHGEGFVDLMKGFTKFVKKSTRVKGERPDYKGDFFL